MLHAKKKEGKKGRKVEGLKGGEEYTERRRVCDTMEGGKRPEYERGQRK